MKCYYCLDEPCMKVKIYQEPISDDKDEIWLYVCNKHDNIFMSKDLIDILHPGD